MASVHAIQSPAPQQAPPQFRAGTEIVQLDVLVLDTQRRPVRGLTADDFIVLENGKPQPVVSFASVDVPAATPVPSARWMREVPADISTNQLDSRRVVAIVFDDATVRGDLATLKAARDAAHKVFDVLGPSDVAAVVFTLDNRRPQDFTTDRAKLHAAVDLFSVSFHGACDRGLCSIRPLTEVSRVLQGVPGQRKSHCLHQCRRPHRSYSVWTSRCPLSRQTRREVFGRGDRPKRSRLTPGEAGRTLALKDVLPSKEAVMSCARHFLNLEWPHHTWKREVIQTQSLSFGETDMWGRRNSVGQVLCHAQLVCQDCGAVKDDGDCGCEAEEGAVCQVRVAHLRREASGQ